MGPIVDFCQMLKIEMGVDLGGFDIGVAKQFLYCTQVTAGFEQMGGEGMTQHVGMDAAPEPLFPGPISDPFLNRTTTQAPALVVLLAAEPNENRLLTLSRECGAPFEPPIERIAWAAPSHPLKLPTTRTARAFGAQTAKDVPWLSSWVRTCEPRTSQSRSWRPSRIRWRSSSPMVGECR